MKKVLFIFGFLFTLSLGAIQAQSCTASKSCCSAKAEKAASSDATIEKRMADNGTVAYVRKEADQQGSVKFVSVRYDEGSNTFVNVAPKATATEGMVKKTATTEKACAMEGTAKAGCCKAGAGEKKACCAKEGASKAAPAQEQK